MMKPKITPSVDYNFLIKRLETQVKEPTNENMNKKAFL